MAPPKGLLPECDKRMCKLQKSIYGLKLANRNLFEKLSSSLILLGYTQSKVEYTLFFNHTKSNYICLLIYVDDIIITVDDLVEISKLK